METEEILKEMLEQILIKLEVEYSDIQITEDEKNTYEVNITSDNPSLLIGYHGDNIQAIQHLLKTLAWKKCGGQDFNILVDVENYRKRQEENVLGLAERKVDMARKTRRPQNLPPMSPYFRRKVHMLCMNPGFEDIETFSEGKGDHRFIIISLK